MQTTSGISFGGKIKTHIRRFWGTSFNKNFFPVALTTRITCSLLASSSLPATQLQDTPGEKKEKTLVLTCRNERVNAGHRLPRGGVAAGRILGSVEVTIGG